MGFKILYKLRNYCVIFKLNYQTIHFAEQSVFFSWFW